MKKCGVEMRVDSFSICVIKDGLYQGFGVLGCPGVLFMLLLFSDHYSRA
jgi:hypothetical protein